MTDKDGGPHDGCWKCCGNGPEAYASVCDYCNSRTPAKNAMTLRDWFAGQALQGMLAAMDGMVVPGTPAQDAVVRAVELMAPTSYAIADAMLEEREK